MISTRSELERQVAVYVDRGYPALAGMDPSSFQELFLPAIKSVLANVGEETSKTNSPGHLPFALVVTRALVDPELRVPLLTLERSIKPGIVDKNHWSDEEKGLAPYSPTKELGVPPVNIYAILDVDRGDEFRNLAPEAAVHELAKRGRTPLTIDEGISLVTLHPQVLQKNHCFMLAGSDRGDRRMPALWISEKAPKLGWCYKGNPHSWLGVASAGIRVE